MIIQVGETKYSVDDAITEAALGDLLVLKAGMVALGFPPVSVPFIKNTFVAVGEKVEDPTFDQDELIGDDDFLATLIGVVWLAKRAAGEKVSVADAAATKFSDFAVIPDEDVDADPKESTDTPLEADDEPEA